MWWLVIAVAATIAVATIVALRVLDRDRDRLHAAFAQERLQALEEAARSLEADIAEIDEDIALAATLLESAESAAVADREIHAIATIKREYFVIETRKHGEAPLRVVAHDAPAGLAARVEPRLAAALDRARAAPGQLHVLAAVDDPTSWHRIYASTPRGRSHAIAIVVDTSLLVARLKLVPEAMSIIGVLAGGQPSPRTDPRIAELAARPPLRELVAETRSGASAVTTITSDLAQTLAMPATVAVAMAVPVRVDEGPPWTLLVIRSTAVLGAQERTLVRRILVLGGLVLALIVAAAAYVTRNARRNATLRESLRHADRLAHLTEKAEKIVDHIPSGVLTLSEGGRITSANRWFAERIGRDLVGRSLDTAFEHAAREDLDTLLALVAEASQSATVRSRFHTRLGLLGQDTYFNIHAVPLARAIADVRLLLVFDDLTEQRRIEERLLHSEKLVTAGQLAAGIAHEVGTPLNIARGRAELLQARMPAESQERANHQIIIDQIDRVTRLIQQLLDYVRPTITTRQPIDLGAAMQAAVELLAPEAGKRRVVLTCHAPTRIVIEGDPDRLQQILVNLVMNGIDACTKGGHVELRATAGDEIQIEVIDDGDGILPELQSQVFDPFFTTKKRGQGTGLGLWVVAQLVRAQGAELELDSEPGRGTTVRIRWAS